MEHVCICLNIQLNSPPNHLKVQYQVISLYKQQKYFVGGRTENSFCAEQHLKKQFYYILALGKSSTYMTQKPPSTSTADVNPVHAIYFKEENTEMSWIECLYWYV